MTGSLRSSVCRLTAPDACRRELRALHVLAMYVGGVRVHSVEWLPTFDSLVGLGLAVRTGDRHQLTLDGLLCALAIRQWGEA